jgi:hypothetical protein
MDGTERDVYETGYLFPSAVVDVPVAKDKLLIVVGKKVDPCINRVTKVYQYGNLLLNIAMHFVYLFNASNE